MREINELHSVLFKTLEVGGAIENGNADALPIGEQIETIKRKTFPNSQYSKTARAQLLKLQGGAHLCAQPEEFAAAA